MTILDKRGIPVFILFPKDSYGSLLERSLGSLEETGWMAELKEQVYYNHVVDRTNQGLNDGKPLIQSLSEITSYLNPLYELIADWEAKGYQYKKSSP